MRLILMTRVAAAASCGIALAACHKAPASGQVLATVGGKDITLQDVRAEGRAGGVPASAGHAADVALLQRVVDRALLAQSAHDQKLDQTPESPSDLARIEQGWRADKAAKKVLVGLKPPSDADVRNVMAEHPYAFGKRERITARTLTIAAAPALLTQLKTYKSLDAAQAFLKRLGVAMNVGVGQLDTAQLPSNVAAQLISTAPGTLLVTTPPGRIQLAEVQGHAPVASTGAEQLDGARRALLSEAAGARVIAALKELRTKIKVTYQTGYAPPPAPAPNTSSTPRS